MPSWCGAQLKHRDNFTFTFRGNPHLAIPSFTGADNNKMVPMQTYEVRATLALLKGKGKVVPVL
jgi:hypothetical protein